MSFFPAPDPAPGDAPACDALEQIIVPRTNDLGGFSVRRALPSARRRMVGPFIFLDHMGPAEFRAGTGVFPFVANYKFTQLNNENVWAKAMSRVVNERWTAEKAVDEMIARIKEVASTM